MIVLIDNYDSFSYNLYQLVGSLYPDIRVIRNDACTVEEIAEMDPDAILLSPGPGKPEDAGICVELVRRLKGKFPILGICLGHQSICTAYGAKVSHAKSLMHGKQSLTKISTSCSIFKDLPEEILVARYHSLSALEETMPDSLLITARSDDGEIMAVKDKDHEVYGLQFHPESILTPDGSIILKNFLTAAGIGGKYND